MQTSFLQMKISVRNVAEMCIRDSGVLVSIAEFLGVFAVTQIPLAIAEGIVTVLVFNLIAKYGREETKSLNVFYGKGQEGVR